MDHHFAHAISAYSYSGFDDAAIVVMDGRGAWEATSIWRGSKGRIEHLQTINWPDSLGLFYARFTEFLGFTPERRRMESHGPRSLRRTRRESPRVP